MYGTQIQTVLLRSVQSVVIASLLLVQSSSQALDGQSTPLAPWMIGFEEAMISPEYWIARTADPDAVLMTPQEINKRNAASFAEDPSMHNLALIGPSLSRAQILSWMKEAEGEIPRTLVDRQGAPISIASLERVEHNLGKNLIPASPAPRYGLSVRRATLRTLPTSQHVYQRKDLIDFDAFQDGVLFPGDPVVIAHMSVDGKWFLVFTTQGAAWVQCLDIAVGTREQVFSYVNATPFRVVTGDKITTVFTPEAPEVSELQLDMGVRVPLAKVGAAEPINGESAYVSWPIDLPVRAKDGSLSFQAALMQKVKDTSPEYLPLTRANIIRQAFKFLGERYGWGHSYDARDCSGFTSDVYRSMGIFLTPNSGAQGRSPVFETEVFSSADSHESRVAALRSAQPGDLVVVPGHVLMILGQLQNQPYVIQDVPFAVFRGKDNQVHMTKLNEVSVTPLLPLLADDRHTYVDSMTSLVHIAAQ